VSLTGLVDTVKVCAASVCAQSAPILCVFVPLRSQRPCVSTLSVRDVERQAE